MWNIAGFGGVAGRFPLGDRFAMLAQGNVGYYYWNGIDWDATGVNGGGLMINAGTGAVFRIAGPFSLGVGASYDYYADLYNGLRFDVAFQLDFPIAGGERPVREKTEPKQKPEPLKEKGEGVELGDIRLFTLFPVLYKCYDTNPVGTAAVKNFESKAAEDVQFHFFVERYMDNPMKIAAPFDLGPGEQKNIELFGLFTEDVLDITEGTKASAKITLSYTMGNREYAIDYTPVLEFHNRNALSWDDDRKIASFITAKDPEILSFSKQIVSWIQGVKNPAVDENLQKGIALFEAVRNYGIHYEIDPTTPFSEFSENETSIDFLQFPRQTFLFSNGDCDDLTALYTSLLEAVGVETAVITIPGHIYAAFALKLTPEEARRAFSSSDELIFIEDTVWVPVEITLFQDSFEKAWQEGAKEWRENDSREQAHLYPTRNSWETYQAVGFREQTAGINLPSRNAVTSAFSQALTRHLEREIYPQVARLQNKMAESKTPYIYKNKLAVLYARHGLYEQAMKNLEEITDSRDYSPALINLGNIYYLQNNFKTALDCYERVMDRDNRNKTALLGVARCHHELENYGFVGSTYDKLKSIDPDMATRFAYLDLKGAEAGRAASAAGVQNIVVWEEEE